MNRTALSELGYLDIIMQFGSVGATPAVLLTVSDLFFVSIPRSTAIGDSSNDGSSRCSYTEEK